MKINIKRTARLKAFLTADYKSGNKKTIYEIVGLFRKLNMPTGEAYKKEVLKPLLESGFISIIRNTYFVINLKGMREINGNGGDINKKTNFSQ